MLSSLQSVAGLLCFFAIAWALSEAHRHARWQVAAAGVLIQLGLGLLLLTTPFTGSVFAGLGSLVDVLQQATLAGTAFVFGYVGGGEPPFVTRPGASSFILAFQSLPILLVMSVLTALLTYWRILPWLVRQLGRLLERGLHIGGALGLGTAANVLLGMVEAPLTIRPYLARLSRSELFALMSTGMATIAGTVYALYAQTLSSVLADAAGHLLVASLLSVPAAISLSLLMVPESGQPATGATAPPAEATSIMDAIALGTQNGIRLLVQVTAMLLVFVALVALVNAALGMLPEIAGGAVTLERLFGILFAPLCWLMGIPWSEAATAGALMGTKTVLNELLAYLSLAELPQGVLSPRSTLIMSYALCGFANFGSLGIMIGGLTAMVPARRAEILELAPRSLVSGTLATCCTGCVAGLFAG